MKEKEQRLSYNMQFFAEKDPDQEPSQEPDTTMEPDSELNINHQEPDVDGESNQEPELSAEEQLQQMMVENLKLKKAQEKAASEAADFKKKYNATLTDKQKADIEKAAEEAERQERFNELLRENTITKLEKNFLTLGYPEAMANKAATAQYDGDTDSLFKIQGDFQKELSKKIKSDFIKSRPDIQAGNEDDDGKKDPFLVGFGS